MGVLIMAAQMIAALTILVTIHEFGHYITAKWFNVQVDKFFVFFDVPLGRGKKKADETAEEHQSRGWDGKLVKTKKGETEYGLGWLPLGGYVKLGGMIDESMDKDWEEIPREKQFRFKPAWQKLIIMLAGIFLNVVLGVLIYFGLNATNKQMLPLDKLNGDYIISDYGKEIGLEQGDVIIGANGKELLRTEDVRKEVFFGGTVEAKRDGEVISVDVPENYFESGTPFFGLRSDLYVGELEEGANAQKAGLEVGDKIVAVNGEPLQWLPDFSSKLMDKQGDEAVISIERSGETMQLPVSVNEDGKIGFIIQSEVDESYKQHFTKMNVGQAINYGVKDAFDMIFLNIRAFGQMGKGKIKPQDSVAGPFQIATMFGDTWDWTRFWTLTATLSMILAFMNLLPIPALDGGHAVFAIIEMITGKPVNERVLEVAQVIGFFLIMTLMVLILGNDIWRIASKAFGG